MESRSLRWGRMLRARGVPGLSIAVLLLVVACAPPARSAPPGSAPSGATPPSAAPGSAAAATEPAIPETKLELVWRVESGIGQPTGLALAHDGSVLAVDWATGTINKISADGTTIRPWGTTTGDGALAHPAGIAVDSTGRVFVGDHDHFRVARFSATGSFELAWGTKGTAQGDFEAPDVVAIGPDRLVYVSEDANQRLQVFEPDGRFVREITSPGAGSFADPTGIAFGGEELYVADYGASRIWVFSTAGEYLRSIGHRGNDPGGFDGLSMIATDASGNVVATDYEHGRLVVLAPTGELVGTYLLEDGSHF